MHFFVMPGTRVWPPASPSVNLVPGISLRDATQCPLNRDGRDKPGHDG